MSILLKPAWIAKSSAVIVTVPAPEKNFGRGKPEEELMASASGCPEQKKRIFELLSAICWTAEKLAHISKA